MHLVRTLSTTASPNGSVSGPVRSLLALASVAVLAAGLAAQGKPDFSGEWTLAADKSDFGVMPAPARMTRTIAHKDPTVKIVTVQSGGATGDRTIETTFTTDGTSRSNTVTGNPMTTVGKWEGAALVFSSTMLAQGVDVLIEDRFELSDGGKTLTVTRRIALPNETQAVRIVMTKQ